MEYEFEPELEDSYRTSLIKSFKRQVDDGFFPFIIVDCIHNKVKHFAEMAAHAKKCNFEVRMSKSFECINNYCYLYVYILYIRERERVWDRILVW